MLPRLRGHMERGRHWRDGRVSTDDEFVDCEGRGDDDPEYGDCCHSRRDTQQETGLQILQDLVREKARPLPVRSPLDDVLPSRWQEPEAADMVAHLAALTSLWPQLWEIPLGGLARELVKRHKEMP